MQSWDSAGICLLLLIIFSNDWLVKVSDDTKIDVQVNNHESREIIKSILDPSLTSFSEQEYLIHSGSKMYLRDKDEAMSAKFRLVPGKFSQGKGFSFPNSSERMHQHKGYLFLIAEGCKSRLVLLEIL